MSASAALDRLRRAGFPAPPPPSAAAAAAVITGTGFWGPERAAIRELAGLAGLSYSGDLVRGATTHLVLAPQAGAAASRKLHKAAEWGVPVVRLGWLVDSIAAGQLQPVQPYLLDIEDEPAAAPAAAEAPGWQQQQQQAPAAGAGQAWPERHRPSSIASNALQAAQQAACGDAFNSGPPEQQQPLQQPQQQQQPQQRGALAAVDNLLADQLCRMCISPEPPQHASSVAAPAGQQQQQQQPPAAGSRAQQRSPSASPQRSLSLAGMVAGGQQAAAGESPAADASTMQDSPGAPAILRYLTSALSLHARTHANPLLAASENDGAGGQQPEGWSPMQQSPADLAPAWQQPQQPQQRSRLSRPGSASPFAFSLAGALGRSISEGLAHGSPMADSPAAAVPAAEPSVVSMEAASAGGAAQASPAPRAMSDGQASGGGSQGDPLCTMPTPACIRAWTDDDSLSGSPPAALPGGATPGELPVRRCAGLCVFVCCTLWMWNLTSG